MALSTTKNTFIVSLLVAVLFCGLIAFGSGGCGKKTHPVAPDATDGAGSDERRGPVALNYNVD